MTAKPKTKKAYQAHDGDEQTIIIFATNSAAARRHAANEMDCEFESVDYCRRAPGFDQFAHTGEPIPAAAYIDNGWWLECAGCNRHVDDDPQDDDGYPLAPVFDGPDVYCCSACYESEVIEKAERKAFDASIKLAMVRYVLRRWPGAIIKNTHVYSDIAHQAVKEATITFDFPGGKYGATHKYLDRHHVTVMQADLAAWYIFDGKLSYHLDDWENEGGALRSEAA